MDNVLSYKEASDLLDKHDILVTKKRNYIIETLYSHYAHTHHVETLDCTRDVIKDIYPDYLDSFDKTMKKTHMHAFNMFVMKKELLNDYCDQLFNILFEVEKRLKDKTYDAFQARYPGRLSEMLLDVWINKNQLKYKEVGYIYFGKNNMHKKIWGFLMAAIFHKRYKQSF